MTASVRALAAAIVVVLVGGVLAAAARGIDPADDFPDRWDPRLQPLVDFVEAARGLRFEHPVEVQFLSPDAYLEATSADSDAVEDPTALAEELEGEVARLRALGVVSGRLDLGGILEQTIGASTLGFYSSADETIRVRGSELTVGVRVTLVHELTHVLQDQRFDLDDLLYDEDIDAGAYEARLGLVEGDAVRTEDLYVAEVLDDRERQAYAEEVQADRDRSDAGNAGVPAFIRASFAAPYELGTTFATMLANAGGNREVDRAFRDPPATEEALFDPASFLADEVAGDVVTGLDDDAIDQSGPFGPVQWYLVLADRIDPSTALEAALGWDGDEFAVEDRDGTTCVRVVFRGDTEEDEAQMAEAIDQWRAAFAEGRAKRVEVEGRPGIDACDPGPAADLQVADRSLDTLVLPFLWGVFVAGQAHAGPDVARCVARMALDGIDYSRLVDPDPSVAESVDADLRRRDLAATSACGSGDR